MIGGNKKALRRHHLRKAVMRVQQEYAFDSEIEFRTHVDAGNWAKFGFGDWRMHSVDMARGGFYVNNYKYEWPNVFAMWRSLYAHKLR